MPTYRNITDVNLTKGFEELLYYTNDVTNSLVSNLILFAIYIITAMGVLYWKKDLVEGFAIAGFFTFLVSFLFWLTGFISGITFTYVIAIAIAGFGLLWFGKK